MAPINTFYQEPQRVVQDVICVQAGFLLFGFNVSIFIPPKRRLTFRGLLSTSQTRARVEIHMKTRWNGRPKALLKPFLALLRGCLKV